MSFFLDGTRIPSVIPTVEQPQSDLAPRQPRMKATPMMAIHRVEFLHPKVLNGVTYFCQTADDPLEHNTLISQMRQVITDHTQEQLPAKMIKLSMTDEVAADTHPAITAFRHMPLAIPYWFGSSEQLGVYQAYPFGLRPGGACHVSMTIVQTPYHERLYSPELKQWCAKINLRSPLMSISGQSLAYHTYKCLLSRVPSWRPVAVMLEHALQAMFPEQYERSQTDERLSRILF